MEVPCLCSSLLPFLLPTQYTYLLTTQLESQRLFFEEKIARFEKEANEQVGVVRGVVWGLCFTFISWWQLSHVVETY